MGESGDMTSLDENLDRLRRKVDARIERLLISPGISSSEAFETWAFPLPVAETPHVVAHGPVAVSVADDRPTGPAIASTAPPHDMQVEPWDDHPSPNYGRRDWWEPKSVDTIHVETVTPALPVRSNSNFFAKLRAKLGFARTQ